MSAHPAQSHILMAGGQDGVLAVWDLRSTQPPATLLSADKVKIVLKFRNFQDTDNVGC